MTAPKALDKTGMMCLSREIVLARTFLPDTAVVILKLFLLYHSGGSDRADMVPHPDLHVGNC